MDLAGTTIALTGATGFLGSHIAIELARRGAHVRGVVRTPSKGDWLAEAHGVRFARADLGDRDSLKAAFDGADIVVSNAAAVGTGKTYEAFYEANVQGTENVMQAIAEAGVPRAVVVSTIGVYKTRLLGRNDESTPMLQGRERALSSLFTDWRYSSTKAEAERRAWDLAAEHGIDLTTVRPGPIYGERDDKLTTRYAKALKRRVVFAPTLKLPHVHAGDVAQVIAAALEREISVGRAYNVVGDNYSPHRIAHTWRRLAGTGPTIVPLFVPLSGRFDDQRAREELGYRPRSLEEGLAGCVAEHAT